MYKEFSTVRLAALRQEGKEKQQLQQQLQQHEKNSQLRDDLLPLQQEQQSLGIHAARCFLGALLGYQESGWLAAEKYTCTVLPAEVRRATSESLIDWIVDAIGCQKFDAQLVSIDMTGNRERRSPRHVLGWMLLRVRRCTRGVCERGFEGRHEWTLSSSNVLLILGTFRRAREICGVCATVSVPFWFISHK